MSNEESQAKPAGAGHTFLRSSLDAVLKWFAPRKPEAAPNAKSSPASTEDREAVDESAPDREIERVVDGMSPQDKLALCLEIGHMIDRKVGGIPLAGAALMQARRIYNDMHTPPHDPRMVRQEQSGVPIPEEHWVGPENHGYQGDAIRREYAAISICAYLLDPNYIKTVGPDIAFLIRDQVRRHPTVKHIIRFN